MSRPQPPPPLDRKQIVDDIIAGHIRWFKAELDKNKDSLEGEFAAMKQMKGRLSAVIMAWFVEMYGSLQIPVVTIKTMFCAKFPDHKNYLELLDFQIGLFRDKIQRDGTPLMIARLRQLLFLLWYSALICSDGLFVLVSLMI